MLFDTKKTWLCHLRRCWDWLHWLESEAHLYNYSDVLVIMAFLKMKKYK